MRTKRMKKFLHYSTTFIICLLMLSFAGNFILDKYYLVKYNNVNENINLVDTKNVDINNTYISDDNLSSDDKTVSTDTFKKLKTLDDYRLEYNNRDIVGSISIIDTDFNMLLVQTTNNSYYLNHLVNKEKNKLGATFVDYRVDLNSSKKINIYGHNNGHGSISFNRLMNYLDSNYYEQYKLIEVKTDISVNVYEVFSVQLVSNNNHMQISFTDIEWNSYIENIINDSLYDANVNVDDIEQMVTLQTCTNYNENEFLLIHGRIIKK